MPSLSISVPGKAASGRPRIKAGGRGMYNVKPVRDWMNHTRSMAVAQVANQIPKPVPIGIMMNFYLPWPKGTPKAKALTYGPHPERPDIDNLMKPVLDALSEAGLWGDDSQIDTLGAQKWRCPRGQERAEIVVSW